MTVSTFLPVLIVPFVGWRLYTRFHRLTRRQPLRPARLWISAVALPLALLAIALGVGTGGDALAAAGLAVGAIGGVALAQYGLRTTRVERVDGALYYTPNARIGMLLFALLVLRLGYRLAQAAMAGDMHGFAGRQGGAALLHSPLTLVVIGLILAYYSRYAIGILRYRKAMAASTPE